MHSSIGLRLKEERERLGLSQVSFGDIGGVKKLAQLNYEKGERYPDASYLSAVSKFGVDVLYVITGIRSVSGLSDDEQELLHLYKKAPLALKAAALAALNAGISASTTVNVSGQGNRAAGRDYTENNIKK